MVVGVRMDKRCPTQLADCACALCPRGKPTQQNALLTVDRRAKHGSFSVNSRLGWQRAPRSRPQLAGGFSRSKKRSQMARQALAALLLLLPLLLVASTASALRTPKPGPVVSDASGDVTQLLADASAPGPVGAAGHDCLPIPDAVLAEANLTDGERSVLEHICWNPPEYGSLLQLTQRDARPPGVECTPVSWCVARWRVVVELPATPKRRAVGRSARRRATPRERRRACV